VGNCIFPARVDLAAVFGTHTVAVYTVCIASLSRSITMTVEVGRRVLIARVELSVHGELVTLEQIILGTPDVVTLVGVAVIITAGTCIR